MYIINNSSLQYDLCKQPSRKDFSFFSCEDILRPMYRCLFQRLSESLERSLCEKAGTLEAEPQQLKKEKSLRLG